MEALYSSDAKLREFSRCCSKLRCWGCVSEVWVCCEAFYSCIGRLKQEWKSYWGEKGAPNTFGTIVWNTRSLLENIFEEKLWPDGRKMDFGRRLWNSLLSFVGQVTAIKRSKIVCNSSIHGMHHPTGECGWLLIANVPHWRKHGDVDTVESVRVSRDMKTIRYGEYYEVEGAKWSSKNFKCGACKFGR